jgi:hypothetical protein
MTNNAHPRADGKWVAAVVGGRALVFGMKSGNKR